MLRERHPRDDFSGTLISNSEQYSMKLLGRAPGIDMTRQVQVQESRSSWNLK